MRQPTLRAWYFDVGPRLERGVRLHCVGDVMTLDAVLALLDGALRFVGFVVVAALAARGLVRLAVRISCVHCPNKNAPPSNAKSDP